MKLVGISQRMAQTDFGECRDCLAHDWYIFLHALGVRWIVIPNDPEFAVAYGKSFTLEGIILTGGDDLGLFPQRDTTELALLDWARAENLPLIGVCRGLQVINHWLGGELAPANKSRHCGQRHSIRYADGTMRLVNSYHNHALVRAPSLKPLALDAEDGSLEAACAVNILGVMWHPEREEAPVPEDIALFRNHFGLDHI